MAKTAEPKQALPAPPPNRRQFSYANSFSDPFRAGAVRLLEWVSAKWRLIPLILAFERRGTPQGQAFWAQALDIMGIAVQTPTEQLDHIPPSGPLLVVANHPHGLIDGLILAHLVGQKRQDYKILARNLQVDIPEISEFLLPVPFPHAPDAQEKGLEMRGAALAHLRAGGAIIVFPAGEIAHSRSLFGPALEGEWHPFTAQLLLRSGATVLPVFIPGSNSRLYQIAAQLSPVLRQGLLLHEIRRKLNRPLAPVIGPTQSANVLAAQGRKPRALLAYLRAQTLALRG